MHEQIKKLYDQAWAETTDHYGTMQKFAELIVKECVSIVNSLEQYEGRGDCSTAEYIKEHFGVEE